MENIMNYNEILFSTKDEIATITLNNPAKINALSKLMVSELTNCLTKLYKGADYQGRRKTFLCWPLPQGDD